MLTFRPGWPQTWHGFQLHGSKDKEDDDFKQLFKQNLEHILHGADKKIYQLAVTVSCKPIALLGCCQTRPPIALMVPKRVCTIKLKLQCFLAIREN